VWEGFAKPSPGGEGFGDPAVFARAAPRTAIGITAQNHLLLVTTARGTSLGKLAAAMRSMGCLYAFNLDGGGSAAMWFRGKMIVTPAAAQGTRLAQRPSAASGSAFRRRRRARLGTPAPGMGR
jgi:hypothetical protein